MSPFNALLLWRRGTGLAPAQRGPKPLKKKVRRAPTPLAMRPGPLACERMYVPVKQRIRRRALSGWLEVQQHERAHPHVPGRPGDGLSSACVAVERLAVALERREHLGHLFDLAAQSPPRPCPRERRPGCRPASRTAPARWHPGCRSRRRTSRQPGIPCQHEAERE